MISNSRILDRLRKIIYDTIYGTQTWYGKLFDLVLLCLILLTVVLFMLETVESINQIHGKVFLKIEYIITIFFTIEYFLRIISHPKPKEYIFSFYGIVDLIALSPLYLENIFEFSHTIGIIRVLRLLRLFKILGHPMFSSQSIQLRKALMASRAKIIIFIYFVLVFTIIIGTLMYLIEGKQGGFTSIPAGIYWCIVTLTTVGFGDIVPVTNFGRFLASVVMIMGYGIIAVPTGIVTSEMTRLKLKYNKKCDNCAKEVSDSDNFCKFCGHQL